MLSSNRRSRRTLLGGLLAATGLAGSGLAAKFAPWASTDDDPSATAATPRAPERFSETLYLDQYKLYSGGRGPERQKGDQSLLRGTLLTASGERAGELFATAVTMPGPVDTGSPHTARMEVQNLHLHDGTILAMGTVFGPSNIPNVYAVIGGTGRYTVLAGATSLTKTPTWHDLMAERPSVST